MPSGTNGVKATSYLNACQTKMGLLQRVQLLGHSLMAAELEMPRILFVTGLFSLRATKTDVIAQTLGVVFRQPCPLPVYPASLPDRWTHKRLSNSDTRLMCPEMAYQTRPHQMRFSVHNSVPSCAPRDSGLLSRHHSNNKGPARSSEQPLSWVTSRQLTCAITSTLPMSTILNGRFPHQTIHGCDLECCSHQVEDQPCAFLRVGEHYPKPRFTSQLSGMTQRHHLYHRQLFFNGL
jgi:hypothetical protein